MSNKQQLQTNNTKVASLIETLRGKASGGGANIETCTVTINSDSEILMIAYNALLNGEIGEPSVVHNVTSFPITLNNVICNTPIVILTGDGSSVGYMHTCTGDIECIEDYPDGHWSRLRIFICTGTNGASIAFVPDSSFPEF